jgi:short-subunit dehydrogenase
MRDWRGRRYWIVGASEGLGAAVARRLSSYGCELVLSARREAPLHMLAAELRGRSTVLPLDVSDPASVTAAAERAGRIDGVVVLAATYWPMRAQDWDAGKVEAMLDVNLTGTARVIGAVIGDMLARDEGHIVLTGSLAGHRGLPGATGYGASKAGVMWLAEGLRADLRGTGILVQLANPGFIRTRLTARNAFRMPFLMTPEDAADRMVALMATDAFSRDYPTPFAWLFRAGRVMPWKLWHALFVRQS